MMLEVLRVSPYGCVHDVCVCLSIILMVQCILSLTTDTFVSF